MEPTPSKTVLLAVTVDGTAVIVHPAGGSPTLLRDAAHLREIVLDPLVKPSRMESSTSVADLVRETIRAFGAPGPTSAGENDR